MSAQISYKHFAYLLHSQSENTVKNALQEIFELLVSGNYMEVPKIATFKHDIKENINSDSPKLRKWAYHCAAFYQDDDMCQLIIRKLAQETNRDNIMWALIGLSRTYDTEQKLRKCVGRRHEEFYETISHQYLKDALILFGGVVDINPKTILLTNNGSDLEALTKIYAYDGLVHGLYPEVTESVIREIETHDNPRVREYAFWAQVLRGTKRKEGDIKEDTDPGVRKWQVAQQIESGTEDFIISVLKPLSWCPEKVSLDVKSGVLRGLNKIPYSEKYVSFLCRWFSYEITETVLIQLLNYFIKNAASNRKEGSFFDILESMLNYEPFSLYLYDKIRKDKCCGLKVEQRNDEYVLDYTFKGEQIMQNFQMGSGNVINTGSGNTFTVANDHSSVSINAAGTAADELAMLIAEVRNQAKRELTEEDQQAVDETLSVIEEEANSPNPRKSFIKTALSSFEHIKNAVQFGAAVANLIKFFS